MKEDGEMPAVRLISVHDGLSPFRRFPVIHPSLISSLKIILGQRHKARTHTCTDGSGHRFPFKMEIRIKKIKIND